MKLLSLLLFFFSLNTFAMQSCQNPKDCCMQVKSAGIIAASCLELGMKIAEIGGVFALETFKMSAAKSDALDKVKAKKNQ